MNGALKPLDLVKFSVHFKKPPAPTINTEGLAQFLEEIAQEAASLINADEKKEFLYKNPNGWQQRQDLYCNMDYCDKKKKICGLHMSCYSSDSSTISFAPATSSSATDDNETDTEPWHVIEDFEFHLVVRQINEYVQTWELSPATKFVVIGLSKTQSKPPFGTKYFVEVHFSKPTPKCPNPLAVAKVYFEINVSNLLPKYYPVNVTYKFEGYESQFHAMGELKMSSNRFQRFYIDSILHMKLAFYAKLCECRNAMKGGAKRRKSSKTTLPKV